MRDLFKLEVDIYHGGYNFIDSFEELLDDIEKEYDIEIREQVHRWAKSSDIGETFYLLEFCITNLGRILL